MGMGEAAQHGAGAGTAGAREEDGSSLRLVRGFEVFGPAYLRWLHSRLRDQGLSYARMRLLGALEWSEDPVIMSDLGAKLGVTPRNVTKLVDALEGEGLLRRRPHPTDRRATVVDITQEGHRTAREEWAEHQRAASELFEELPESDRRELLRLLDLLNAQLRQRGMAGRLEGPAAGD